MPNTFKVDSYEPQLIENLIRQVLGELVIRADLNNHQWADYMWNWWSGEPEQTERKQNNEVLSSLEDVEYQLVSEIFHHPEGRMTLLVEGIIEPSGYGIQTFKRAKDGKVFYRDRYYNFPYQRYEKWKADLERKGVLVWPTTDAFGTANALVALYHSAQDTSRVLQRYLKVSGIQQPKPDNWDENNKDSNGKPKPWKPNPYVQALINTPENGVGVELAQRLIDLFSTPWDCIRQTPQVLADYVPGMDVGKAKQFLRAYGRNV